MKTQAMLRALANGVHPETGEVLGTASMTGSPEKSKALTGRAAAEEHCRGAAGEIVLPMGRGRKTAAAGELYSRRNA